VTTGQPLSGPRPVPGGLGGALRRAVVGYRLRMDTELATAGFTDRRFPDGRVLGICAGPGETTISDIGHELGITRQGASKIVAGLRQRGYLAVTPSAADGREKILTLTPRASEYLQARRQAANAIERALRDQIGADGEEQLLRFLDLVAGDDPTAGDRSAIRALRWLDSHDQL
jgi:DNA-binding MarR family transcriptional regulator